MQGGFPRERAVVPSLRQQSDERNEHDTWAIGFIDDRDRYEPFFGMEAKR